MLHNVAMVGEFLRARPDTGSCSNAKLGSSGWIRPTFALVHPIRSQVSAEKASPPRRVNGQLLRARSAVPCRSPASRFLPPFTFSLSPLLDPEWLLALRGLSHAQAVQALNRVFGIAMKSAAAAVAIRCDSQCANQTMIRATRRAAGTGCALAMHRAPENNNICTTQRQQSCE